MIILKSLSKIKILLFRYLKNMTLYQMVVVDLLLLKVMEQHVMGFVDVAFVFCLYL